MIARGTLDIFPRRAFDVYKAALSGSPILFTKNMVIAYSSKALVEIVGPQGEAPNPKHKEEKSLLK